jgi:hypothetical protein
VGRYQGMALERGAVPRQRPDLPALILEAQLAADGGLLNAEQESLIRSLPLDFEGMADLNAWLAANA